MIVWYVLASIGTMLAVGGLGLELFGLYKVLLGNKADPVLPLHVYGSWVIGGVCLVSGVWVLWLVKRGKEQQQE